MTKPQAIQSAYTWAWNTHNDKKSPTMSVLCAKQVLDAVDAYGVSDACYEVLGNLLREWRASKRQGFELPIKIVANSLSLVDPAQSAAAQ